MDEHVPDLLALHPSIALQSHPGYLSGLFILQDKASCLPATVLSPPRNKRAVVIDATAAPGNKTSHLSALMGNIGKVSFSWRVRCSGRLTSCLLRYTHSNATNYDSRRSKKCLRRRGAKMSKPPAKTFLRRIHWTPGSEKPRTCKYCRPTKFRSRK